MLKRTPFYDFHVNAGAKMVPFAGWEMPLLYRGIIDEHEQTRKSGSLFDVSHMGRLHISGKDAEALLNLVLTRNVSPQKTGQSRYSLICNESGGVIDDVIVSRFADHWLIVCNASGRDNVVRHLQAARDGRSFDARLDDRTESTAMIALQGPRVIPRLGEMLPIDLGAIKRYSFENIDLMVARFTIFRSGYTGEDGVELIFNNDLVPTILETLQHEMLGKDAIIKPAGLGSRDTLRLEASMPLYGHELTDSIDPISAGLGWAVDLKKDFIGAEPLRVIATRGPARKLVGIELEGRRIARQGAAVQSGAVVVGVVTSGTFSPTLQKSLSMAYIDANHAAVGTALAVDLKGAIIPARVVAMPFYKRPG